MNILSFYIQYFRLSISIIIPSVFFTILLVIGIAIYRDYGISWDEPISRTNGILATNYVLAGDERYFSYSDRYYGVAFEMMLIAAERVFKLIDKLRELYFMRHLLTFLSFYVGVFFFYLLCLKQFKSWKMALLGCLILVVSPRVFAHSFYNSKDIPLMVAFIICMYSLLRFLDKTSLWGIVIHAFFSSLAIGIRITGVVIPLVTLLFIGLEILLSSKKNQFKKKIVWYLPAYIICLCLMTIAVWPLLWKQPFINFIDAFQQMSHFPFPSPVLYFGKEQAAADLPWHYLPVWIGITTPIFYLYGFISGVLLVLIKFIKQPIQFYKHYRNALLYIVWFFGPLSGIILLDSVVYDEWRQMLFIYPGFVLLVLIGFSLIKSVLLKRLLYFLLLCSLVSTIFFMVMYHPYQNVYFNLLAGIDMQSVKKTFEMDYWGLSYRQGLEYIAKTDQRPDITVYSAHMPGEFNVNILPQELQARLVFVQDIKEADYYLTNYRWDRVEYKNMKEYYFIYVRNTPIMGIYSR